MKADGKIVVASVALGKGSNDLLEPFVGKALVAPRPAKMAPNPKALACHANVFCVRPDDPQGV